jgi:DNA-binding transcriptional ArsR family regulator
MRTRRDHARFLNLIEVSAFLHQHQREKREGAVVASLADYETAYGLSGQVLTETLSDLKRPLREAYARIRELSLKSEGGITRSEIREALALPDSTVRRWLGELVELEYLEADQGKQGKAVRYALTGRAPKQELVLGLLSPADLRRRLSNFATSPNFATARGGV